MPDRFYTPIDLPDGSQDPSPPEDGNLTFYGKSGRPTAQAADGGIIDMGNLSVRRVAAGTTMLVPENADALVMGGLTVEGAIAVEGRIVEIE